MGGSPVVQCVTTRCDETFCFAPSDSFPRAPEHIYNMMKDQEFMAQY